MARPSEAEIQRRIDEMVDHNYKLIDEYGFVVTGVFATEPGDIGFSYSTGFLRTGLPELYASGNDARVSHYVIGEIAEIIQSLPELVDRQSFQVTIQGRDGDISILCNDVSECADVISNMTVTRRMYPGHEFRIYQVLLPDVAGHFPGTPEYDGKYKQIVHTND